MSKRSASPTVQPLKLAKVEGDWTIASSPAAEDVDLRPMEKPARPSFKPVPAGPKARIQQNYVLSYTPRLDVTINLNGNQPEVRFASLGSSITLTGDELLQLANCRHDWPANPIFLLNTRLEPLEDGCFRFVRYEKSLSDSPAQIMDNFPTVVFDVPKYAVQRLKTKLDVMSEHVFKILESEPIINQMFDSVVQMYKAEYGRMVTLQPIVNHFDELSRLLEAHVPPSHIVNHFCSRTSSSRWNHYSLLASTLAQKVYLKSMLDE